MALETDTVNTYRFNEPCRDAQLPPMGLTAKQRGLLRIRAETVAIAIAVGCAAAAVLDEFLRWFWTTH